MSEALAPKAFIKELVGRIEARRTFGSHPLWLELADGKLNVERGAGQYVSRPSFAAYYDALKKQAQQSEPTAVRR